MKYLTILSGSVSEINTDAKMLEWACIIPFTLAVMCFLRAADYRDVPSENSAKAAFLSTIAGVCLIIIGMCLLLLR